MTVTQPLAARSVLELADALRAGETSSRALTELYLARIEAHDGRLGAYVTVLGERALAAADAADAALRAGTSAGPLHGVPIAIKDLEDLAGVRTTNGSRAFPNRVARTSAICVERLLAAGAVVLGKTNTPELGHKGITDNLLVGPASTPFLEGSNAGGSSGGSAVAVAAGLCAAAQGGDGGGSIRIPAALCGIYGLKPSFGRVPHRVDPDAFSFMPFVSLGPMTRTVADAALLLEVMAGGDERDPRALPGPAEDWRAAADVGPDALAGMRIGWTADLGGHVVDPEVVEIAAAALAGFEAAGAVVEPIDFRLPVSTGELVEVWERAGAVGLAAMVAGRERAGLDPELDRFTPTVRGAIARGRAVPATQTLLDGVVRTRVYDEVQRHLAEVDFLVSPTLTISSAPNDPSGVAGGLGPRGVPDDWPLTPIFNFTGHPAASLPAGFAASGAPIGLQLVGRRFRDDLVLRASAAFELHRPWRAACEARLSALFAR